MKKKETAGRQLTIGVDVFHPIINYFIGDQHGFELAATYYTRNDYYLVLDGGAGGANVAPVSDGAADLACAFWKYGRKRVYTGLTRA